MERIDQPQWASKFKDQLIVAQSTRLNGVSKGYYSSLNLGLHTQDSTSAVQENRRLFCADLGCQPDQLAGGYQIHGNQVQIVKRPGQTEGYDAFVTNVPGIVLTATIADCAPVLLYDPVQQVVGAAHAGWRGTVGEIAGKTLQTMVTHFNTNPADCWAYVGTCIGAKDFEVDADVAGHFAMAYKTYDAVRRKFLVDLKTANGEQLLKKGLRADRIEYSPYSTVAHNEHFFSHRKEQGKTGRMLAAIGLK